MLDRDRLCADFEDCIGWPYVSPGGTGQDCSAVGIDCSGMFARAFRLQGGSIDHGSNTIWRKHLGTKGVIAGASCLEKGMAVFKWNPTTPDKFADGLGDFQHIGLVTSVSPLRIVHASTEGMKVKVDGAIGRWKYWGRLKGVRYDMTQVRSAASNAGCLRKGSRGSDVAQLQLLLRNQGYDLAPDGIFGSMTEQAVASYQASHGLARDGIVGEQTWAALGVM